MSIRDMVSDLQKSTKITLLACLCFLLLTAVVLFFLMLFPLDPSKDSVSLSAPAETTNDDEVQESTAEEGTNTEAPHTLSTWSASIDGYTKFTGEYIPYIPPDDEDDEDDEGWSNTTVYFEEDGTTATEEWQEGSETVSSEESNWGESSEEYVHSDTQTVTETVQPPATEPEPVEPTDPPAPVETDPAVVNPELDVE